MPKEKNMGKGRLSIRSKLILMMSLVVIIVSLILLYFTSQMIYKDKKAYLYDNSFTSVKTSAHALSQFFAHKKEMINLYRSRLPDDEEEIKTHFSIDNDLFQILAFTADPHAALAESATNPSGQMPLGQNGAFQEPTLVIPTVRTVHRNLQFIKRYRKRVEFLGISDDALIAQGPTVMEKGIVMLPHTEADRAPRLLILIHVPAKNLIYCFDYLMDNFLESVFSRYPYEMNFVNVEGKTIFSNKPFALTPAHQAFFKTHMSSKAQNGVSEAVIGESEYIVGFTRLDLFSEFSIFSGIKKEQAYEVTSIFIMNTALYALVLIGIFSFLSIYLARSITTPLDKLTQVIKEIAGGKFNARVESQKTTELEVVGQSFNKMVEKIQDYNTKLVEANKTLEQKVEARTAELKKANIFIKTTLDSIGQGLLVFGRDGICSELYTKVCEKLLGVRPAYKDLGSLLKVDDRKVFKEWVQALFDEMIPFDALVDLGQKSLPCKVDYKSDDFKHVTLEFFPMRNQDKIENVVLVATDKTKEFKASKELEEQKHYVQLVSKIFENKGNFKKFVAQFEEKTKEFKAGMVNGEIDKEAYLRFLHTMKGTAGFYHLEELMQDLHHFEDDLGKVDMPVADLLTRTESLLENFYRCMASIKQFISDEASEPSALDELKLKEFWKLLYERDKALAECFADNFLKVPVESYIRQYKTLILELAPQLGKKINPLQIENGNLPVDKEMFQAFFDSSIHLFRNALDHAIERPEVRVEKGKNEVGTIGVNFEIIGETQLAVHVHDDGGGIDANRVREKMRQLGYPEEELQKSDESIIYHIFDPSFSTAEQVSTISGRGIGLHDIKKNVETLGGSLEIQTKLGKGSIFSFFLPLTKNS